MKGKRVQFNDETWLALDTLARDSGRKFADLVDEAIADLLNKYHRPVTLKDALRESSFSEPDNGKSPGKRKRPRHIETGD